MTTSLPGPRTRARGAGTHVAGFGVATAFLLAATAATGQLPSVAQFLAEPLHTVRGHLPAEVYGGPSELGVELTMPTSVEVGDFAVDRSHFARHAILLPTIQIAWAHGYGIDDLLTPAVASETRGVGFVAMETAGSVTRGDGWVARVWTSELRADADASVDRRSRVEVVMRLGSPHDLDCLGHGYLDWTDGRPTDVETHRLRDWLIERCRSVRIVTLP